MCDHALGTDSGGSIRIPAAYCGVVGLKPTFGLVPLAGVFPLSPTCDHVGTLTRTVEQTAALLGVIASTSVTQQPFEGLRIGVLVRQLEDPDLTAGVPARVLEGLESLRAAGFELVDVDVPELELVGGPSARSSSGRRTTSTADCSSERPIATVRQLQLLEAGARIDDDEYRAGLADRDRVTAAFERVFAQVAVLAGPTAPWVAPSEDPRFGAPEGEVEGRSRAPTTSPGPPRSRFPAGSQRTTCPPASSWRPL